MSSNSTSRPTSPMGRPARPRPGSRRTPASPTWSRLSTSCPRPDFEVPEEAPDELVRTVLEEGDADGREAQRFDTVEPQFIGVVIDDGSVWESTFGMGDPIPLTLGQPSLPGLDEGLRGVRPGDVLQLDLPADEAFGETGSPDGRVPPDSAMTFVVEVDDVTGPPLVELPEETPERIDRHGAGTGHRRAGRRGRHGVRQLHRRCSARTDHGSRTNFDGEPYPVTIGAGDVIAGWDEGLVGATDRAAAADRRPGRRGLRRRRRALRIDPRRRRPQLPGRRRRHRPGDRRRRRADRPRVADQRGAARGGRRRRRHRG